MLWLDSDDPPDKDPSTPGVARGPCPLESSTAPTPAAPALDHQLPGVQHECNNPTFSLTQLEAGQIICDDCCKNIKLQEYCWTCQSCHIFDLCKSCMQFY